MQENQNQKNTFKFESEADRKLYFEMITEMPTSSPETLKEITDQHSIELFEYLLRDAGDQHTLAAYQLLNKIFNIDFRYHEMRDFYEAYFADEIKKQKEEMKAQIERARKSIKND